ncbi:carbohydrate binding domain-containing protein [Micromonospora humida]|uniref:carbohydrate binding domain-containing protein n=1 Tax=Micromonospora humida TaxID=2809018 RepID=UPI00366FA59F
MATYDLQFVDSITATPAVRLNLRTGGWRVREGTSFGMPQLNRAIVSTLLRDGDFYPAAAYGNRVLTLLLRIDGQTDDDIAAQLQRLYRELDRAANVLMYRPGTSQPVFFRTFRCGPENVTWNPHTKEVSVQVPAESFAIGVRETLPAVTVGNDPTETSELNANPFFEVDASGWVGQGGSVARSTAQAHEGSASLLLTPDGVTATAEARAVDLVPVTAGQTYRASAWLRCAATRSISCNINWHNGAGTYLSTSTGVASVTANVWQLVDFTATAPGGATQARLVPASLGSTPPVGHTTHVDEARIRLVSATAPGGLCFDVASPKGDVETPLYLSIQARDVTTDPAGFAPGSGRRTSLIAVRRRGTPSAAPVALPVESMSLTTDTTLQAAGGGSQGQFARVSFIGTQTMQGRATIALHPAASSVDVRGTYRVFVRVRHSVSADVMQIRMVYSTDSTVVYSDAATVPSGTAWRWVDTGLVQMPLGYDPGTDGLSGAALPVQGVGVYIQAARVSGSGNLDLDTVMLIPADDRLATVRWPEFGSPTSYVVDSSATAVYATGSAGEVRPAIAELAALMPMVSPGITNRVYLMRDVGSEYSDGDDATGYVRVTPYYWPRYLYVRPVTS